MRQFDVYVVRTQPPRVVPRILQVVFSVGALAIVVANR